jgi:hypothetical protein
VVIPLVLEILASIGVVLASLAFLTLFMWIDSHPK